MSQKVVVERRTRMTLDWRVTIFLDRQRILMHTIRLPNPWGDAAFSFLVTKSVSGPRLLTWLGAPKCYSREELAKTPIWFAGCVPRVGSCQRPLTTSMWQYQTKAGFTPVTNQKRGVHSYGISVSHARGTKLKRYSSKLNHRSKTMLYKQAFFWHCRRLNA